MEDLKILKLARFYMSAMSTGINPLTGEFVPENDSLSNERIQKCCEYMVQLVDKVIENNGYIDTKSKPIKQKRKKFFITPSQINEIRLSDVPIGVNELAKRINAVIDENMRGISGAKIAAWMAQEGYLGVEKIENTGKTRKVLNEKSQSIGLIDQNKVNIETGEVYKQILYTKDTQYFVLNNIKNIMNIT